MSWGFEVEKRKRVFGNFVAQMSNNSEKPTAVAWAISDAFLKSFFKTSFDEIRMLCKWHGSS